MGPTGLNGGEVVSCTDRGSLDVRQGHDERILRSTKDVQRRASIARTRESRAPLAVKPPHLATDDSIDVSMIGMGGEDQSEGIYCSMNW